eukprot:863612-Prorocentrum_minimum.AAC.1
MVGFAALIIAAAMTVPKLGASDDLPLLFPRKHNVQRFINLTEDFFLSEDVPCASYWNCVEYASQVAD